ncbi:MAG TPA: DUF692 family protein [Allosphingosinicella sp.]
MAGNIGRLGVGAVYWAALHDLFAAHPDIVQVAEVEPSSFWIKQLGPDGAVRSNPLALAAIESLPQAKLLHGVGYPVGGTRGGRHPHIGELLHWAERLDPAWTSEHLSFNETESGNAGFLLPPCQSADGVAIAAANIRARASALGRPFAFETGVNYLRPRQDEMDDGAYFAAVAREADCHILLDLHNLWANERNGRARVRDVVAALPLDRVCEVHLAGGEEKDGYWLDAHCGLVPAALFDLALEIMPDLPAVGAIIFEIAPEHLHRVDEASLLGQIETLHRLWERRGRSPTPAGRHQAAPAAGLMAAEWEQALAGALSDASGGASAAIALYRSLIAAFRNGALATTLTHSLRLLQLTHGKAAVDAMLDDYGASTRPPLYPSDEAVQFATWLKAHAPPTLYLDDMLGLEEGIVTIACGGAGGELSFDHDPSLIVAAIADGRAPEGLPRGHYRIRLGPQA